MSTILIAGATGMLGGQIAEHLLDHGDSDVRPLVRPKALDDPDKAAALANLQAKGAEIAAGDVSDPASLDEAARGVDVIISALQGGAETLVDGQIALAEAAVRNGARRFFPSDFAIDLFAAPTARRNSTRASGPPRRSTRWRLRSSTCSTAASWT